MTRKQWLIVAASFVVVATASYLVGSQRQSAATARQLADLQQRQHALEAGVLNGVPRAQLASQLGYASPPAMPAPDERERRQPTPAEAEKARQDRLAALDKAFMSEPLDPKWAGQTKASVEDSLVSAAAESGVQPRSFSADCRSKSCMIDMQVGSGTDMDRVIDVLTTEISGKLPSTTMIPVTAPDGSVTLHIYGTQQDPAERRRPQG